MLGKLRWVAVSAALAALALAGCGGGGGGRSRSWSGTRLGRGELGRAVRISGLPRGVEVVNRVELNKRGNSTYVDVQLRNNERKGNLWQMEYSFQFFDGDGFELPALPQGVRIVRIERGGDQTVTGSCYQPGAVAARMTIRRWRALK